MYEEIIDYLKELSLVIFPIIIPVFVGLIGSKKIIHSWQIQKDKQAIRKKILDEFNMSYPKLSNHYHFLFNKIRFHYVDKTKLPNGQNTYQDSIVFPNELSEQPLQKFKEIPNLMENEQEKFYTNFDKFQSNIILFFESFANFQQDLDIIAELQNNLELELIKILQSKTREEFIQSCINFQELKVKLGQKFNFIRTMIVYEKIYNPEKGLSKSFFKVDKGFEANPSDTEI